jgi:hypothetical protein
MGFSAWHVDQAILGELLRALQPLALEAAVEAERNHADKVAEEGRIAKLELQQARYDASLAERRYAACDPDNRLTAAQLEKNWEEALRRVRSCEEKLDTRCQEIATNTDHVDFGMLAVDLEAAWNSPLVTMRTRQRLVTALIQDIVANVDEEAGEVVLTIHWKGGQHSELRTRKPRTGEHRNRASEEAVSVISSMAGRWPDAQIAATLNRMGFRTGQAKSWNTSRVESLRQKRDIRAYRSAQADSDWLTMSQAARELRVTNHVIRKLIQDGILPAEQVVPRAPYQIRASDLRSPDVSRAIANRGRPCQLATADQPSLFSNS